MEVIKYYCDICDIEISKTKKIRVQIDDTLDDKLKIVDYHICYKCEKRIRKLTPIKVHGINNQFKINRKPKFKEEL